MLAKATFCLLRETQMFSGKRIDFAFVGHWLRDKEPINEYNLCELNFLLAERK